MKGLVVKTTGTSYGVYFPDGTIADCHVNNDPCALALMSENISYPIQAKLIGLHNADAQVITKENKLITTSLSVRKLLIAGSIF